MDEAVAADNPNLSSFLETRLPELGLDLDTYAPYVLGGESADSEEDYEEELAEILQLLQASTTIEELADDQKVWEKLKNDILEMRKLDKDAQNAKHAKQLQENHAAMEAKLAQAKLEQEKKEETIRQRQEDHKSNMDDATRKTLLNRFAYENDEEDAGNEDGVMTNKQVAAATHLASAREQRAHKVQTKKEEQQKTKEQRANKQQLKEERRKRAQKGERKR